jgi:hypothetical protein
MVNCFTRPTDPRLSVINSDGHDIKVQIRRKATIEPQLLTTKEQPLRRRAHVHEGITNWPFYLVGKLASQKYPRNMRFDEPHMLDGMRIGLRRHQGSEADGKATQSNHPANVLVMTALKRAVSIADTAIRESR